MNKYIKEVDILLESSSISFQNVIYIQQTFTVEDSGFGVLLEALIVFSRESNEFHQPNVFKINNEDLFVLKTDCRAFQSIKEWYLLEIITFSGLYINITFLLQYY